ncbi:polyphosphate kinase 1 [uncultured Parolsenella sp.]|uniref:polyphosphate kinase 1 n=1 Tax=uncultured Parolsenella sp. TaxID=2083008 RepID=UPI002658C694|nr:polyphosphate kinase 1 [uncultured Parolsenella sp.]
MGKKKDKKREAKLDELGRRAAEFADETPSPANERKPKRGFKRDFSYTQNREVSWLRFDDRVLDEAFDETVPLFERIKFCAIFQSNMDEWFMIRIGGLSDLAELKHQPADNKSDETPAEQLESVFGLLPGMYERRESCLTDLEARLALEGVERVSPAQYTDADLVAVSRRFEASLAPILSPIIIDPRHPFPNLRNDVMYVACSLDGVDEHDMLGIVEVPPTAARIVWLPSGEGRVRYTLVEDVVSSMLSRCFGSYVPTSSAVVRVTRNADIDPDGEGVEEEEDYRQHMKKVLKRRSRLQPVRLELTGALDESLVTLVRKELGLEKRRVFRLSTPADLSYVYALENRLPATRKAVLTFTPFEPQPSPMVDASRPMRDQIEDHDVLLTYPYESMGPLLRLIHEAANDDACISIKITLYRVARHSRLCESLVAAVENGKDVTVLMELRARFDEQNNIEWAERLEEAGCTVIYGSEGFKCHSKICQITYHDNRGLSRVTCLGTGNFNEKTARLYSDFMLITAHPGIAEDGNAFFRNLSLGNLRGTYRFLGVAPLSLKPLVMGGIDREIARARAGEPARVFLKMNSLTDRDVIDRLADASQAGVEVVMIIRGICCMLPGVKGRTTGIEIRQIVGRLLEHARIYSFGVGADTIYLSSADMMTRNTERRVEIAYPVLDPTCRRIVCDYMALQLSDNVKARRLTSKGTWAPIKRREGEPAINCQEQLMARAYARAHELEPQAVAPLAPEPMPTTTIAAVDETVAATEAAAPMTAAAKAKQVEQVEQVDQAAAAKHGPAVAPMAQPAIEDEPEPAAHVEAHVIEDEQPAQSKVADADAPREQPAAPGTLAKRAPGRLVRALAIFGLGFKTLFGKDEQR